jgi:hypothetical protein
VESILDGGQLNSAHTAVQDLCLYIVWRNQVVSYREITISPNETTCLQTSEDEQWATVNNTRRWWNPR